MQTNTTFSWSASVTSIKDYPIEIHKGYLATEKEFITAFRNNGIERNGWDVDGQEGNTGGSQIPTLLSLSWVSYVEKKVWLLDEVKLPADKILALFKEGFYSTDRVTNQPVHETYEHIVVGVAPGGVAVFFLTGNYHRVEVARYQAVETFEDVNKFMRRPGVYKDKEAFLDDGFTMLFTSEQREKIKKDGIPFGLWDTYRTRYNWRFDVHFYKENDKIADALHFYYINGEEEILEKIGDEQKIRNKALPKIINIYLPNNWCEATFDEAEIIDAFKKVTQGNPKTDVVIVAKVQFMYKGIDFTVKCGTNEIVLKKVKQDMWGYN